VLRRSFILGALGFTLLVALIAIGGGFVVESIRIGGPAYTSIVRDKDLVADILPPPAYVIEANLEVAQAFINPADVGQHKERLAELHRQYTDRMKFWADSDLPESVKTTLGQKVDGPAQTFWVAVEDRLIPALERGDPGASEAYREVQQAYRDHRQGVDAAVLQATELQKTHEAEAKSFGELGNAGMALGVLALLGGLGVAVFLLNRTVFSPLGELTATLSSMSQGRSDVTLSGSERKDELGEISRAVVALQALIIARMNEASKGAADARAMIDAAGRSQAIIEFDLAGNVLTANQNFLDVTGYALGDIQGRHHQMFVDRDYAGSAQYGEFWRRLNAGEFITDKCVRYGRGGKRIVIEAIYNPILGADGKPYKIVKFASDVTAIEDERERRAEVDKRAAAEQSAIVAETGRGLTALAAGDLSYRIEQDFPGEYAQLKADFNAAMAKLADAMGVITANASAMQTGSSEISQAADDLSRRTEQQAATLEQTAAALDQITATVRRTAEGARRANVVVTDARQDAETSGQVVTRAVAAMDEIQKSAEQISQIIGVIDEIAFQTNLLALNAGVEAARAGDAGRGFAVVASEVRALAQRSAEAAKEIKSLISASTSQVRDGVGLVGQTGQALTAIVGRVSEINSLMAEINASAQEQATALGQVNTAINQMDQTTQQNAAMVEQSTAASHSLSQEAGELAQLVGRFKIGTATAGQAARHALRPVANPVRAAQARISSFASQQAAPRRSGNAALALANTTEADWEEF
jgi:methyl-accepting chemotaxis protein